MEKFKPSWGTHAAKAHSSQSKMQTNPSMRTTQASETDEHVHVV